MRLLGKYAFFHQREASGEGVEAFVEYDGVEKAFSPNDANFRKFCIAEFRPEAFAEHKGAFFEPLRFKHLNRRQPHRSREGVPAKSGTVSSWSEHIHDLSVGDNGGDRHNSSSQRLSEAHDIGSRTLILPREAPACPAKTRLNFVEDEEDAGGRTDSTKFGEISFMRHDNPGFALNGLDENRHCIAVDGTLNRVCRSKGDFFESWHIGAIVDI